MSTTVSHHENEGEWVINGEIDLSAAAAVSANRGSNQTAAKTGTGTYTVTLAGASNLRVVELLNRRCGFAATAPATALTTYITSVVQTAGEFRDTVVITIKTANAAFADTDTTAATTLSFQVVARVSKMGNPL